MAFTQDNRSIFIDTPLGKDVLLLVRCSGTEEISSLFSFELEMLSENHSIAFKDIIGKNVTVSILLADGSKRYFNGIISRFSQGRGGGEAGGDVRFSNYTATMVPFFWLLTRTSDSRIFQGLSVPDIVEKILKEKEVLDYEIKLHGSYDKRDYCVQYRETDFNFVSRLLEEEGIYYFFRHEDKKHVLVISDVPDEHKACPGQETARYQISAGGQLEEDMLTSLDIAQEIRVGKYTLKDFNFETPSTDLKVEVPSQQAVGPGEREVYDYPGGYGKRAEGDRLANIRMQEEEAAVTTINGSSNCRAFTSGFKFDLKDYYRDDMNNKSFVLTSIYHEAVQAYVSGEEEQGLSYGNNFSCIPFEIPFRPRRRTPRPVVEGIQTAIVVGPKGEEIYPDEHARVKVQFHWDREGKNDENSSCWIRVSQLWAGAGWGAMYIPRIGHEVVVDFIEGDPDRPLITGRVYHGSNKPPYSLPGEKTKSTIKSDSSLGGGGSNEFRFEDKKGSEEIFLHGQKDWTIAIENDKNQTVGHDETLSVGNNRTKSVGVDQSETIGSNKTINVGANHNETIGANKTMNIGANHTETIAANMSLTVGSNQAETIAVAKALTIGTAYQVTVGAAMNETIGALKTEEIGAAKIVNVGASSSENIGANKSVEAGGNISESAGKDVSVTSGKKMSLKAGDDFSVSGGKKGVIDIKDQITIKCGSASITMKKNGDITIEGKNINVKGSGNIVMKANKIMEN
ncbi:MAG: type VI secretion system tip protein VgrG [Nitrospiraceae bacterium]|nr:MAG: type VI secretion system tip protein VgrG [Nitrospiraceae bacterium]